jgi:hypothetical protein
MEGKKRISFIAFILVSVFLNPSQGLPFSSGTHLYIADRVFQDEPYPLDLYYGAIAPDLDFALKQASKWPTAFDDTHHNFVDLRSFASGPEQMAFAKGWFTHNEKDPWGIDHYAHIDPGYVIQKAKDLTGVPSDFAHLAIEVAVDVLLRDNEDHQLGGKLSSSLQRHSSKDRTLLTDLFVTNQQRTDRLTLIMAEMNYRQVMLQYARALSKPSPDNKEALAKWGVMLAQRLYGTRLSSDYLLGILEDAIALCKDDYKETKTISWYQINPSPSHSSPTNQKKGSGSSVI